MTAAFVDTSFILTTALVRDALHGQAMQWNRIAPPFRVVTEYVLIEVANYLCDLTLRAKASRIIHLLRNSPGVEVVPSSASLFDRGLDLYAARLDKSWSLTDCISFIVMQDLGLSDALTADRHFEQAGFRALLRLPVPGQQPE